MLFIKLFVAPLRGASHLTVFLLSSIGSNGVFGEFRASIQSQRVLVMFIFFFYLLDSENCEVPDQVLDQIERSYGW